MSMLHHYITKISVAYALPQWWRRNNAKEHFNNGNSCCRCIHTNDTASTGYMHTQRRVDISHDKQIKGQCTFFTQQQPCILHITTHIDRTNECKHEAAPDTGFPPTAATTKKQYYSRHAEDEYYEKYMAIAQVVKARKIRGNGNILGTRVLNMQCSHEHSFGMIISTVQQTSNADCTETWKITSRPLYLPHYESN